MAGDTHGDAAQNFDVASGGGTVDQDVNLVEVAGASVATGHGTAAGAIRVELPTDGTGTVGLNAGTNTIGGAQPVPGTTGGLSTASALVPNNTTAVVVKGSAGQVYRVECFNNGATNAYLKIYNATSATAGAGTPLKRYMIPVNGFVSSSDIGIAFSTGITYIVTTGIADSDTGAPAASTFIVNIDYK